jgi:hypothetical protein
MTESIPGIHYMSEEESDLFEHEMFVIEVFDEWQWKSKDDKDYIPDFFRGYRPDESIRYIYDFPPDEDLSKYEFEPMVLINKSYCLRVAMLYTHEDLAEKECQKIEKIGIKTRIRKVDVRLKDD